MSKSTRNRKHNRKAFLAVLAMAVIVVFGGATTVAFINHSSNNVVNTFVPSSISCSIDETVENMTKSSVRVQNTGDTAAYIRVAVIANRVNNAGEITGAADVSGYLCGSGWVKSGMYYYYTQPVAPGEYTGELLSGSIDLKGIQVTVLADAIQSEPADAALTAWKINPGSLGSN